MCGATGPVRWGVLPFLSRATDEDRMRWDDERRSVSRVESHRAGRADVRQASGEG